MTVHTPKKITLHCSDTPNGQAVSIEAIRKNHLARGFDDIGYHGVINTDGEFFQGRALNHVGAHVEGDNAGNLGICLAGKDKFTEAQYIKLRYTLDSWFICFQIPKWALYCHNQFDSAIKQGKTCPSIPINNLLYWYHSHEEKAIAPYKL